MKTPCLNKTKKLKKTHLIIDKNKQLDLFNNCKETCDIAASLQNKMNKKLLNSLKTPTTYKDIKNNKYMEKIDYKLIKNISEEREEKGLFVYGKSKFEKGQFVKSIENNEERLDKLINLDDEAVYKVRNVLLQKFGISIGKVKKKKVKFMQNNNDENHEKVNELLDGISSKKKNLIREIKYYQKKNV